MDGFVQQVLSGLDSTDPKPGPVQDATDKSLEQILNSITIPPPEAPTPQESVLDKLIMELRNPATGEPKTIPTNTPAPQPDLEPNPFGSTEDWGEERY